VGKSVDRYIKYRDQPVDIVLKAIIDRRLPVGRYSNMVKVKGDNAGKQRKEIFSEYDTDDD